MSAGWDSPCFKTKSGEEAWCTFHLAEMIDPDHGQLAAGASPYRNRLAAFLSQREGFDVAGQRLDCDRRLRLAKVVPMGTILQYDLDTTGSALALAIRTEEAEADEITRALLLKERTMNRFQAWRSA
jgi:hypothetical protein